LIVATCSRVTSPSQAFRYLAAATNPRL